MRLNHMSAAARRALTRGLHIRLGEWALALLAVGIVGWFGIAAVEQRAAEQIGRQVQSTLDICTRGLSLWVHERTSDAKVWANESIVRGTINRLVALRDDSSSEGVDEQTALIEILRQHLGPVCQAYDYVGFVVFDSAGIQVAALLEQALGLPSPVGCGPYITQAFDGATVVTSPVWTNCPLPDTAGQLRDDLPTMFVLTPVYDAEQRVVAVLGFRARPEYAFSRILETAQLGQSAETYAFDQRGRMISQSRFDQQLRRVGLLAADGYATAVLNVQLRDPGGNLLAGFRPNKPLTELPLTRMAQSALNGESGFDVSGYRDYRGVPVVGAWRWLPEFGLGVTHEVDVEEAYAPVQSVRKVFWAMLGLMGATTMASVVMQDQRRQADRERRKVAAALVESDQRHRAIIESALDAVVAIDADGIITEWNGNAESMFGFAAHQAVGQRLTDLIVPIDQRAAHEQALRHVFHNAAGAMLNRRLEVMALHRDGHEIPVELAVTQLQINDGYAFSAFVRDLSETRRNEERTHQLLAELAHVDRLSTAGQMVSELAHDLNQPLAAAANYARACANFLERGEGATDDELAQWLSQTVAHANHANEIVCRLRDFVRKNCPQRSAVDLNAVIADVVLLLTPVMRAARIQMCLDLQPSLSTVTGVRVQITQVLVNLVHNAIEAMADTADDDRLLTITTRQQGTVVRVAVSDAGCGLGAEELDRLFEPFHTTKPQGMGLGLSISRSIVEAHGGRIWAESQPHDATQLVFTLPVSGEAP